MPRSASRLGPSGGENYRSCQPTSDSRFPRTGTGVDYRGPVTAEFNADADERGDRVASVAVLIGVIAAVIAGATIWLVLTDPVTVANAIDDGEISPLVRQLAQVIITALAGLLDYL